jgi:cytochrome c biogenesis protein CcmG/thiol:disulfide interchange protein DsbE
MSTPTVSSRPRGPTVPFWLVGGLLIGLAVGIRVSHERRAPHEHALPDVSLARLTTPALVTQLGGEEHVAAAARDALIARLGPNALPVFMGLFDHPRPSTRALAVEGATDLAAKPSSAGAASPRGDMRLLTALHERMTDYDALVRLRVVEELPRLEGPAALPFLLGALRDEDEWIRESAAKQLGDLRARESVEALIAGLDDPDPGVVGYCAAALRRITGQPIRYSYAGTAAAQQEAIARWRRWWAAHRAAWPPSRSVPPTTITMSALPPPLEARDVAGNPLRLADLRGQVVLLNFFGSWCYPCAKELPGLVNLHRRYVARGVQVIGLGVAEKSEADLRRFAEHCQLPFVVAIAPEEVLEAYGDIHEVPLSFLIDRRGRIRRIWEGDRIEQTFEAGIRRLLEEQP